MPFSAVRFSAYSVMVTPIVTIGASFTSMTIMVTAVILIGIGSATRLGGRHRDLVGIRALIRAIRVQHGPGPHRDLARRRVYLELDPVGPAQAIGQHVVSGISGRNRLAHLGPRRRVLRYAPHSIGTGREGWRQGVSRHGRSAHTSTGYRHDAPLVAFVIIVGRRHSQVVAFVGRERIVRTARSVVDDVPRRQILGLLPLPGGVEVLVLVRGVDFGVVQGCDQFEALTWGCSDDRVIVPGSSTSVTSITTFL